MQCQQASRKWAALPLARPIIERVSTTGGIQGCPRADSTPSLLRPHPENLSPNRPPINLREGSTFHIVHFHMQTCVRPSRLGQVDHKKNAKGTEASPTGQQDPRGETSSLGKQEQATTKPPRPRDGVNPSSVDNHRGTRYGNNESGGVRRHGRASTSASPHSISLGGIARPP